MLAQKREEARQEKNEGKRERQRKRIQEKGPSIRYKDLKEQYTGPIPDGFHKWRPGQKRHFWRKTQGMNPGNHENFKNPENQVKGGHKPFQKPFYNAGGPKHEREHRQEREHFDKILQKIPTIDRKPAKTYVLDTIFSI